MKFTNFFALAIAVSALVSCNKEDLAVESSTIKSQTLTAIFAPNKTEADSKLSFTNNVDTSLDLAWVKGDQFTVYNKTTEARVGNFIASTDGGVVDFIAEDGVVLKEGDVYVAVYPASLASTLTARDAEVSHGVTQDVNSLSYNHLDKLCEMKSAEFTYSPDSNVTFAHEKAILTFKYVYTCNNPNGGSPEFLSVKIDNKLYNVNIYNSWQTKERYFRFAIDPIEEKTFDVNVEVWTSQSRLKKGAKTVTTKFEAGNHYVAGLDFGFEDPSKNDSYITMTTVDLASTDYSANMTFDATAASSYWKDVLAQTNVLELDYASSNFSVYGASLTALNNELASIDPSRRITLRMNRASWNSFSNFNSSCIKEVYTNNTNIGSNAFKNLDGLEFWTSGQLKEIGANIFTKAKLTTPLTIFIANQNLTTSDLAKISDNAFMYKKWSGGVSTDADVDLTNVSLWLHKNIGARGQCKVVDNQIVDENGTPNVNGKYWMPNSKIFGPFKEVLKKNS